jgi:hypothetical protein
MKVTERAATARTVIPSSAASRLRPVAVQPDAVLLTRATVQPQGPLVTVRYLVCIERRAHGHVDGKALTLNSDVVEAVSEPGPCGPGSVVHGVPAQDPIVQAAGPWSCR